MAQPTQPTTPLDWRTKIVNPDGTPNNYFIRLWQTVYGNGNNASQDIATLKEEVAALEAATLQEGTGIDIAPSGKLLDNPTIALTDTAVAPGTYGDATHVGQFTVDQQGRLTAASNVAISGGGGQSTLINATINNDTGLVVSSSAFSAKGNYFLTTAGFSITRVAMFSGPLAAGTYRLSIVKLSGLSSSPTITSVDFTTTKTISSTSTNSWMLFSAPFTFITSTVYAILISNTSSGTFVNPLAGFGNICAPAFPAVSVLSCRLAQATPTAGQTVDNNSGSGFNTNYMMFDPVWTP